MKKTLLVSTAFFLSAASFAQTKVTNSESLKGQTGIQHNHAGTRVISSENASSATTVHTGIVKNAKDGSTAKIKEENQAMAAEKKSLTAKAKTKRQQTASAASHGRSAAASAHSKLKVDASSSEDNNLSENSSLTGNAGVSASSGANKAGKLKSAEMKSAHASLKGDNRSQVAVDKLPAKPQQKIYAASVATVHTGTAAAHSVRVKPLPVKAAAHIKTSAAVHIR